VDTDRDDGDDPLVIRNDEELGLAPEEEDSILYTTDEEQPIDDDDEPRSVDSRKR
jgi:hypothetical protein